MEKRLFENRRSAASFASIAAITAITLLAAAPLWSQSSPGGIGLDETPARLRMATAQAQPNGIIAADGAAPGDGTVREALPRRVDLSEYLPPIGSQGLIGSCSAWSTVYYAKTIQENQERGWGADDPSRRFSPLFSYNQITKGRNVGTSIDDHMLIIQNIGAVPMASFPYTDRINVFPDEDTIALAEPFRGESYRKLSEYDWDSERWITDIDDVRTVLAEGHPVIGGFLVHETFDAYSGGVYRRPMGALRGSHAMCIVGYDDDRRAFYIVNSWGEAWGENGFMWLSYDLFPDLNSSGCLVMYDRIEERTAKLEPPSGVEGSKGAHADRIELTWAPVETADSYVVLRVDNGTGEFRELGTAEEAAYVDGSLPPGVNYVYAVKSVRKEGEEQELSELSEIAEAWTAKGKEAPGIPSNLECAFYRKMPLVTWDPVDDAEGYGVYRWNGREEGFFKIGETRDPSFLDRAYGRGADMEVIYYVVEAYNAYGTGYATDAAALLYHPLVKEVDDPKGSSGDDRMTPEAEAPAFEGEYYRTDYFDYEYSMRRFREFYEAEQEAFRAYREEEQSEFEAWLQRQAEGARDLMP